MSAQMKRNEEEQHPAAGVAEGGEKKSMMKKVKAKAKKIKDTITKPGHGHADHHDGVDDDDDDDNYEVGETEQGQHVHGAPIIDESKEARSSVPGQGGAPIQGVGGGDRTPTAPAPVDGKDVSDSIKTNTNTNREALNKPKEMRSSVPGREGSASIKRDVMSGVGHPTPTPAVGTVSNTSSPHETRGDRQPDNYQSKAKDLTGRGGEEVGATSILHSFDKMGLHTDATKQSNAKTTTGQQESFIQPNAGLADRHSSGGGSHDKFSPEPISDKTTPHPETEMEQDIGISGPKQQGASYTDKVSSATSLIADKAIQAKNVVASKLGYNGGEQDEHQKTTIPLHEGQDEAAGKTSSVTDYGKKMSSAVQAKASPMYDTGVSAKEYIVNKVSPGKEDKALSEVISGGLRKDTAGSRQGEDEKKRGKVTISDKVAGQLGKGDEKSVEEIGSGGSGPGETVVEMVRGTVTSWLGMGGGETEPSSVVFHDIPKEENEGSGGHKLQQGQGTDGEQRLQ